MPLVISQVGFISKYLRFQVCIIWCQEFYKQNIAIKNSDSFRRNQKSMFERGQCADQEYKKVTNLLTC